MRRTRRVTDSAKVPRRLQAALKARLRSRGGAGAAWVVAVVVAVEVVIATGVVDRRAGAWDAGCRVTPATAAQRANNGIDLRSSAHQWLATRAMTILAADGYDTIAAFLATPDPTAPLAPAAGAGGTGAPNETYGWRLLTGSDEADCKLYSQISDHLHNFWSHRGRRMIIGESAASNAEKAFSNATAAWRRGDKAIAMEWLGASLHLVQDSCVPQHNFYGIGVNHFDFERWTLIHQDALSVGDGAILAKDFRVGGGHGGEKWSSAHPRGWADECAHRAGGILRTASANVPKISTSADPQWKAAPHIAETQRLSAGYIQFFFQTVGGP